MREMLEVSLDQFEQWAGPMSQRLAVHSGRCEIMSAMQDRVWEAYRHSGAGILF